uniref:Uncharacterized protein n=1 Tax=Octopus bimaculoides TaxID=37653 RepID=A0A0L8HPC7_OCTBM
MSSHISLTPRYIFNLSLLFINCVRFIVPYSSRLFDIACLNAVLTEQARRPPLST